MRLFHNLSSIPETAESVSFAVCVFNRVHLGCPLLIAEGSSDFTKQKPQAIAPEIYIFI